MGDDVQEEEEEDSVAKETQQVKEFIKPQRYLFLLSCYSFLFVSRFFTKDY